MSLSRVPKRGAVAYMTAYLGEFTISAEEFVEYKPEVPIGLLHALGMKANSVPSPIEDPITILMNAGKKMYDKKKQVSFLDEFMRDVETVDVGTESIRDGALPMSNHLLQFLDQDDVISSESKHACIASMNAIYKNCRDPSLVGSSDIAHYSSNAAASAEFTGGMGATLTLNHPEGKLLEILDIRGAAASLTYDFYKPYDQQEEDLLAKTYPIVHGQYSNLMNYQKVLKSYENLKQRLHDKHGVTITLDDFSGFVFHVPYPSITKYNLACLFISDQFDDHQAEFHENAVEMYNELQTSFAKARELFDSGEIHDITAVEKTCEKYSEISLKGKPG